MSELPKTYDPKSVEDKLYKFWVDSGFFHAEVNPDKKPYTIVIPPPNVTGQLHMATHSTRPCRISSSAPSACRATRRCGCRAPITPVLQPRLK